MDPNLMSPARFRPKLNTRPSGFAIDHSPQGSGCASFDIHLLTHVMKGISAERKLNGPTFPINLSIKNRDVLLTNFSILKLSHQCAMRIPGQGNDQQSTCLHV